MSKTILVLLDGCGFQAAGANLGYLEHLVETRKGAKYRVQGELPSSSRPMYETLLTGLPVCQHGITNNLAVRLSCKKSIFSLCSEHGLKTAASAYYWISELYCSAPFRHGSDRIRLNSDTPIQNGIFYFEDCYPDSHVFIDGEFLRQFSNPDFLMIHSMNIDNEGHLHGACSPQYHAAVCKSDVILANLLPLWLEENVNVVITADHGMADNRLHGGNTADQREVALYVLGKHIRPGYFYDEAISQLAIAPLLCAFLELPLTEEMRSLPELGVAFFEN